MSWKRSARAKQAAACLLALMLFGAISLHAALAPLPKIKATDADNHSILFNKPGMVSVIIGTSEDSQDAARRAGRAMYPFQGLIQFQLIVVVDLRDSIASWVPSVVIDHMRRSLDEEAVELKPYYLKNGNTANPRRFLHVVPDFKGTIVPILNWTGTPDQLHALIYVDAREFKRIESVDDMDAFQSDVRSALQALARSGHQVPAKPSR